jgi:hypothetical protein
LDFAAQVKGQKGSLQAKQAKLESLKTQRKAAAKHIQIKDLPPE